MVGKEDLPGQETEKKNNEKKKEEADYMTLPVYIHHGQLRQNHDFKMRTMRTLRTMRTMTTTMRNLRNLAAVGRVHKIQCSDPKVHPHVKNAALAKFVWRM